MISSLDSLAPQSQIFIDTNIFLYGALDYTKYRATCRAFLQNIESGTYFCSYFLLVSHENVSKYVDFHLACMSRRIMRVLNEIVYRRPGLLNNRIGR